MKADGCDIHAMPCAAKGAGVSAVQWNAKSQRSLGMFRRVRSLQSPPVSRTAWVIGNRIAIVIPGIILLDPAQADGLSRGDLRRRSGFHRHVGRKNRRCCGAKKRNSG